MSREAEIPILVTIPLDLDLRQGGDCGMPLMVSAPNSSTGLVSQAIVQKVLDRT